MQRPSKFPRLRRRRKSSSSSPSSQSSGTEDEGSLDIGILVSEFKFPSSANVSHGISGPLPDSHFIISSDADHADPSRLSDNSLEASHSDRDLSMTAEEPIDAVCYRETSQPAIQCGNTVEIIRSKALDEVFIANDIVRDAQSSDIPFSYGNSCEGSSEDDGCYDNSNEDSSSDDSSSEDSSSEENSSDEEEGSVPQAAVSSQPDTQIYEGSVDSLDQATDSASYYGVLPSVPSDNLFEGCPITLSESLITILSFAQSEKLSGVGLVRLLKLIELHCPKPNKCLKSLENITDHFESVKSPVTSYFYCSLCARERSGITDVCENCRDLGPSVDQVLVLSLVDQISKLYERPGFLEDIKYRFNRKKIKADNYEDIFDGSVYQQSEENLLSENDTSFIWGSDGFSACDSVQQEVWPFFLNCIELPPEKRFKRENLVLGAVFVGSKKPHPNIFLKYVHSNVKLLNEGFEVNVPGHPEPLKVKSHVTCGTCDSPAKALLFNQKYFNGFYSCPKCLSKGEKSEESEDVFVHPYEPDLVLRTDEGYEESAHEAATFNATASKHRHISPQGIKGTSFLYLIVATSMFMSTSIDTMHCVYLGVMGKLLDLWFSKVYKDEPWSLYKVRKVVDSMLVSIHPPHFVKRMPRKLDQKAKYKAFELMLMMYYYLIPVLKSTMKQPYFHNFKQLVAGMSLLNQKSVSTSDISSGQSLLDRFCKDFQELYGLRHMTFNVHLLRHMHEVVLALGPTCFTTCFGLEDLNGKLKSLIHGSRFVGSQLYNNLFSFLDLPKLVHDLSPSPVKDYCTSLGKKSKRVRINEKVFDVIFSVGKYKHLAQLHPWITDSLNGKVYSNVFSFQRILLKGIVLTSEVYVRSKKCCSSFVKYSMNDVCSYGLVKCYVKLTNCNCTKKCKCEGEFFALISKCNTTVEFETANPPAAINHIVSYEITNSILAIPLTCILNVCFNLHTNGNFLCDPLNDVEMYN